MRSYWIAGLALSLALLGGCTRAEKAHVNEGVQDLGQQVRGAAANARRAAADVTLAGKVKTALSMRKGIDASRIDVVAKDGHVTLKGDIPSREQAELAEQAAQQTDGVTSVENQLMLRIPAKPASGTESTRG